MGSILDGVAAAVDPTSAAGPFASAFANLPFEKKAVVFQVKESDPSLLTQAGALLQLVGLLVYSEAGVLEPVTGALTGTPVGWTLTAVSPMGTPSSRATSTTDAALSEGRSRHERRHRDRRGRRRPHRGEGAGVELLAWLDERAYFSEGRADLLRTDERLQSLRGRRDLRALVRGR